ncbi:hypothetical protein JKP88DRAFT_308397 [Tribonema minus]|uniref:Uncharacterized protein n=1 Tax=Tribonema minus TaxID=303371 RepID=A0A835Z3M8_9STRA|nr:hypothetical protein JKP88DRAFT_308397 [Tribonema minus]
MLGATYYTPKQCKPSATRHDLAEDLPTGRGPWVYGHVLQLRQHKSFESRCGNNGKPTYARSHGQANLPTSDVKEANFKKADFTKANLKKTNFKKTNCEANSSANYWASVDKDGRVYAVNYLLGFDGAALTPEASKATLGEITGRRVIAIFTLCT